MKKKKVLRVLIILLITLIAIVTILIGTAFWYINSRLNRINYVEIDVGAIEINEGVEEQLEGFRSIVILGIDGYGEHGEIEGRSDCIIIATLNEKTSEIKLTSIYRDTYVEIPGRGLDKINHAYAFGGPELALSTININLDLNITEVVVVNFDSVINAIDALGGIEMEITSDETKYINGYIKSITRNTGIKTQSITKAGTYKLDGVQALAYSRIRYTVGGDHKRTERMRTVLIKMLEEAKTAKKTDLLKAFDELLPQITTNVKKEEMIPTILEINKYKVKGDIGWPYTVKAYDASGPWYGVPVTLESDVTRLHKEQFENENYIPSERVKEVNRKIIEKTGYSN